MGRRATLAAVLALVTAAGCSGCDAGTPNTPDTIASSIASGCGTKIKSTPLPVEPGHERFHALAVDTMVIGCEGRPDNRSEYARFRDKRMARSALASIRLRPAHVETFCVAGDEVFTTDFVGSDSVCRRLNNATFRDGDACCYRNVRRPPRPYRVTHRTYIPNCGTAMGLKSVHPGTSRAAGWSSGCTGGSANVGGHWTAWNENRLVITGRTALRGPCAIGGKSRGPCKGQNALYRTKATVRMDDPRFCTDRGVKLRFLQRATFRAYMRQDNPFGFRTGWHQSVFKPDLFRGQCGLAREQTLFGF